MDFRFYWVFIFIIILIITKITFSIKQKDRNSIFPNMSERLNKVLSQNIAPNKIRLKKNGEGNRTHLSFI